MFWCTWSLMVSAVRRTGLPAGHAVGRSAGFSRSEFRKYYTGIASDQGD